MISMLASGLFGCFWNLARIVRRRIFHLKIKKTSFEETSRPNKNFFKIPQQPVTAKRGEYRQTPQNMTTITNQLFPVLKIFDIGTCTCRSLRKDARVTELEKSLQEINWSIIGLSKIRRAGHAQ